MNTSTKQTENLAENGNKSKPLLCDAFIDALPHTDEKIIDKYTKQISTELYNLSKELEANGDTNAHVNARCEINKKYGKFWRERLDMKKIYNSKNPFGKMSYY
jgi:hypothetical protein